MSEPVVRISDQTWTRLQEWAVPLVDSVDDALIRVLDAAGSPKTSRNPRRQVGQIKAKRAQSKDVLVSAGVFRRGTKLRLLKRSWPADISGDDPLINVEVSDPSSQQNVTWKFDGKSYALSDLSPILRDKYGAKVAKNLVNGYKYWTLLDTPNESLWDAAERLRR